jgi:hypothetical protein
VLGVSIPLICSSMTFFLIISYLGVHPIIS